MNAKEQARTLVGEVMDAALDEAKKKYGKPSARTTSQGGEGWRFRGKPRKGKGGGSLDDEGDEEARGRLIGWLIKRGVIKRRGKPGGSSPAKGGPKLKRKKYSKPEARSSGSPGAFTDDVKRAPRGGNPGKGWTRRRG